MVDEVGSVRDCVLGKENMGACELKYSRVARQTSVFEHLGFRSKFEIRTTLKHCGGSATDPSGLRQVLYSRSHCDDELHVMEHSPTGLPTSTGSLHAVSITYHSEEPTSLPLAPDP